MKEIIAFRVDVAPNGKGLGCFATRRLQKGDTVLAKPMSFVVDVGNVEMCSFCLHPDPQKAIKCAACDESFMVCAAACENEVLRRHTEQGMCWRIVADEDGPFVRAALGMLSNRGGAVCMSALSVASICGGAQRLQRLRKLAKSVAAEAYSDFHIEVALRRVFANHARATHRYDKPPDGPIVIDPSFARFNHACDANACLVIVPTLTKGGEPWAFCKTTRAVEQGEEITINYGYSSCEAFSAARGIECKCAHA